MLKAVDKAGDDVGLETKKDETNLTNNSPC